MKKATNGTTIKGKAISKPSAPLPPDSYVTIKGKQYKRGSWEAIEAGAKAYQVEFKQ